MAPERRNEFLDAEDSEDDTGQGYDSEADELQKGGRSSKRRKVDYEEDDYSDEDEGAEAQIQAEDKHHQIKATAVSKDATSEEDDDADGSEPKDTADNEHGIGEDGELLGVSKPLTKKNLVASEKAVKKSGVVYVSRVPPFMKPHKLRSLLSPFGTVNRIFLSPEDPAAHTRRVRAGGNKKKMFTDGWVEFVDKKQAKQACDLLNGQTIGGKKGSYYRDDIWNLLYLKGFKWHNLTEQIAAENAERASRMRAEISRTAKENKEFVRNVEKGKMLDGIQAKKAAKRKKTVEEDEDAYEVGARESLVPKSSRERHSKFKQVPLAKKKDKGEQPEEVKRVLSKIF